MCRYVVSDVPLDRVTRRLAVERYFLEYRDTDMNLTNGMLVAALVAGCPLIVASLAVVAVAGCALFGPKTVAMRAQRILDRLILLVAILRGGRGAACFIERTAVPDLRRDQDLRAASRGPHWTRRR